MSSLTESQLKNDFLDFNELYARKKRNGFFIPIRYIVGIMAMLGTLNLYMCRINLSEAIVAMSKVKVSKDHSNGSDICVEPVLETRPGHNDTEFTTGEFDWNATQQGVILGAFFYGYICFQVVGGRLAEIFGAKWLCGGGILASIIINALTPLIARTNNYYLLIASRVVLGVFQAFIFPSCYALFSKWAPDHERSTFLSFPTIGGNIGSIAASGLSGYLAEHGFAGGWPSIFYVSSMLAGVWLIFWVWFVESEPKHHKWISHEEVKYIEHNTAANASGKKRRAVPWYKIFTSMPVIAMIVTKFTINWNYTLFLLKLPAYLQQVFSYSSTENGSITAFIYLILTISLFIAGFLADVIVRRKLLHKTILRKFFQAMATFGSAICLALIPLAHCNKTLVIALLLIGMFMFGMMAGGDIPVVADMTNNFAATVFAVANTVAFTCGFLTPLVVGKIVDASPLVRRQWSYVFYMSAALNVFGGVFFILFGSAEQQHWDKEEEEIKKDTSISDKYVDRI